MFLVYFTLFISTIIFGEAAIITALYLSMSGGISPQAVFTISLLATLITDTLWYFVGYWFPQSKLVALLKIEKARNKHASFFELLRTHNMRVLFYSKFLHGLRIPVRVLYGVQRMSFVKFIFMNLLSAIVWLLVLIILVFSLGKSVAELENIIQEILLILSLFAALTILAHYLVKKFVVKRN